jgi:hypothetical protein
MGGVEPDGGDDRSRTAAVLAAHPELIPDDAPPPGELRGYLFVDDIATVDRSVRQLMPAAIRTWAQMSAKGHRLRWTRRADWFESLPPVQEWSVSAADPRSQPGDRFFFLRLYRTMPSRWEEQEQHLAGTGDLGWLFWAVTQLTRNVGWIEVTGPGALTRHDYVEDAMRIAERILSRSESIRLLSHSEQRLFLIRFSCPDPAI